ncbi:MAG: diguanylate cyclase [Phycisphaeraceae bacterium]
MLILVGHSAPTISPPQRPVADTAVTVPLPRDRRSARRRRAWNDAPLHAKLMLLVTLAAVGGAGIALAAAKLPYPGWPLALGLIILITVLAALARLWIVQPIDHLLAIWQRISQHRSPGGLRALPITRQDEVGRLSRAIYELAAQALRENFDAQQLRRTLDQRVAQATRQATQQLHRMAMRDPLTDLGNRRFLDETLSPLIQSVLDSGSSLACLTMDCDNFKRVNDTLGHAAGDELLVFLAGLIRANIRRGDYAVRLGGDEFVLLLPDCTAERARALADQLRLMFAQHAHTTLPAAIGAGLSIGIATLPGAGIRSGADLIHHADDNLYAAKIAGKGRVKAGA